MRVSLAAAPDPFVSQCDPYWSTQTGFCADKNGAYIRQNGMVVPFGELLGNPNDLIPGIDNKWVYAVGFLATLFSLKGLFFS
jgi:hypothetical protein